ncbi:MAG: hypothetical protein Q4E59_00735 [Bacteroidales bacterium]|nr:hypothetical protein [Bacteroidales bacterium]
MKRQKITYGVYNIVEWHALLKSGKATISVHFVNGATTTAGVVPAVFTTSDPIIQIMIERTEEYRSGRIKRIRTYDLGGNVEGQKNPVAINLPTAEQPTEGEDYKQDEQQTEEDESTTEEQAEEAEEASEVEEESTVVTVKVSDLAAAKDYLADTYGISRTALRSRKAIEEQAAAQGIVFEGLD